MKIRPLADKVIVQRVEAESKTAGGIVLPDTAKEKSQREVVAVGEGRIWTTENVPRCRSKRARRYCFQLCRDRNQNRRQEYLIMDESDIMAIIE